MMSSVDMVLATGGPAIVEIAYRSGTPSYGVGAGNVPVIIHDSADITKACSRIIIGRTFDNGIICASEQHIIMTGKIEQEVCAEFQKLGGYILNADEQKKLQSIVFTPDNRLQITAIGKNAKVLAERAGIQVPETTKVLLVRGDRNAVGKDPFSSEKMFPVLTLYTITDHKDAVLLARELLDHQGAGHTAAIHINRSYEQDLQLFALTMPATHIIVNQSAATSAGGSKLNWVTPSTTLGCGTYGSTIPMKTINLTTDQLINYKLIVKPLSKSRVPNGVLNNPPVKPMFHSEEEE
jgi:acyl-CoA reductase-like NAD-dependent aldehyde dehydrogenase